MSEGIASVIEEVEELLQRLFIGGLGHVQVAEVRQVQEVATLCERFGLTFAHTTLGQLATELDKRRHVLRPDDRAIVRLFFLLNAYLQVIKEKWQWQQAMEKMQSE